MTSKDSECALCGHPATCTNPSFSSPPADALSSYVTCSSTEAHVTTSKISELQAHVSRLEEEAKKLEASLDANRSECERLANVLDEHRSVLAPIKKVPVEILSKIFLSGDFGGFVKLEAPHLLTLVCRRWRDVAISMPALWSSLDLIDRIPPLNWFCYGWSDLPIIP